MNPFEMTVVIVMIVCGYKISAKFLDSKKFTPMNMDFTPYDSKIQKLEDRIKVLENIVADRRFDLRREFDKLERD